MNKLSVNNTCNIFKSFNLKTEVNNKHSPEKTKKKLHFCLSNDIKRCKNYSLKITRKTVLEAQSLL